MSQQARKSKKRARQERVCGCCVFHFNSTLYAYTCKCDNVNDHTLNAYDPRSQFTSIAYYCSDWCQIVSPLTMQQDKYRRFFAFSHVSVLAFSYIISMHFRKIFCAFSSSFLTDALRFCNTTSCRGWLTNAMYTFLRIGLKQASLVLSAVAELLVDIMDRK